ncbi:hypothetical protein AB835_11840 [Candidatus Endobugula sertula]|uniref:Fibronectin type-III domain-containing protein n=1 Tax=Candidatus Endobugula sertula TaxID=62101 RepID=A0A1D2QMU2_9GAMM|nr:hypothetical protein AB835_11840 [Candidatus Endobugula sertula]
MEMNKLSVGIVLLSALLLASCGGSGGSSSPSDTGGSDNTEDTIVVPTGVLHVPVITSASSSSTSEISVDWKPSQFSEILESGITYSAHAKEGATDFTPDATTENVASITSTGVTLKGLKKDTEYSIKIIASNSNEQSISDAFTAKTSDIDAAVKNGVRILYQSNIKTNVYDSFLEDYIDLDPADDIRIGDILYDDENGFIIKITSIGSGNKAEFRQASLRDMYDRISVDTTIDLSK